MPMTLLLRFARVIAASISRSLRSTFLSIQAPTVTLSPNSAAIGGTSSEPPVDEESRIARVTGARFLMFGRRLKLIWRALLPGPAKGRRQVPARRCQRLRARRSQRQPPAVAPPD